MASTEPGTFSCRIDGSAWMACKSTWTIDSLTAGKHTLASRAKDAAGNYDAMPGELVVTVSAS